MQFKSTGECMCRQPSSNKERKNTLRSTPSRLNIYKKCILFIDDSFGHLVQFEICEFYFCVNLSNFLFEKTEQSSVELDLLSI